MSTISKNSTAHFYNETSMNEGFNEHKINLYLALIKKTLKNKKDPKIMDIGCYDGRFGEIVYKKFHIKIDGVDISDVNLKKAKYLKKKILLDFDIDKPWNLSEKYDIVFAGDVIEHLVHTDQFMININKITKDNGLLALSTPNVASLGRRLMLLMGRNPYLEVSKKRHINHFPADSVGHLRYFTKNTLTSIVENYGFKIEQFSSAPISLPFGVTSQNLADLFPSLGWHLSIIGRKIKQA